MEALRLYFKLIRISMQSRMQYRADFLTGVIGVIVMNVVNLGLISILVTRFAHLNGWTIWEMVFLYCLWILGHSVFSFFFWHIRTLEDFLVQGTFDQFLTRPVSPFILFLGREVQYLGVADLLIGVSGISLAYTNLGLRWDAAQWLFFGLAVVSGTLIETALSLLIACLAFWTGRSRRANSLLMQISVMIQYYPVDIFGYWFRVIVTGFVPVAFMNYYPSLMLLGKTNPHSNWWQLNYLSPAVALLLVGVAAGVWRLALRQYTSSGS